MINYLGLIYAAQCEFTRYIHVHVHVYPRLRWWSITIETRWSWVPVLSKAAPFFQALSALVVHVLITFPCMVS